RHRFTPRGRYRRVALFAMSQPRTFAQLLARALDPVIDGCIDLVLHGTIACPTGCHVNLHVSVMATCPFRATFSAAPPYIQALPMTWVLPASVSSTPDRRVASSSR